ncbi:polysaccharide deacetylase family protein [Lacisediminimonas sp.]|uniref:polysaccharide deacetylase family protein n=1 Tax=Lacisediminimonas sp. TaxID=3060582 RepID=UPI00271EA6D3|nr:polysaccharide deacetylase family protein [Lacisediminimonas sp.]MDO8299207.1 polysaccharide deacetylase family protein [Lacisediminimonas sp.]
MTTLFSCSIDDGHPSDMRTAELLQRHGIAATFYIPVRNREGHPVLRPTEIRALDREFEIGSHTLDHCFLKTLTVDDAHAQISEGKAQLEQLLGHRVAGFCYPGGKYGARDIGMVQTAGFSYARTTMNLCLDTGDNPFEMPTACQFHPHARNVYLRNFIRGGAWSKRTELLRLAMRHENWIERINAMFDYACETGGVFHLWGHSRDIGQANAWDELDAFLARVAGRLPKAQRVDNGRLAALCY